MKSENRPSQVLDTIGLYTSHKKGLYTLYTGYDFKDPNFRLGQKGTSTDSLFMDKTNYRTKTIFTYRYNRMRAISSLTCYRDSLYEIDTEKLKFLSKRKFTSNGFEFNVSKYLYNPKNKLYMSNIYINDSLGILFNHISGQGRDLLQYKFDSQYEELQQKIFQDTIFYKFEDDN